MPQNTVQIIAPQGSTVTPVQKARISAFLDTVGTKKLPTAVVVVPSDKFSSVRKSFGANDTDDAFTDKGTGRIYLNAGLLDKSSTKNEGGLRYSGPLFAEFTLAHELSHLNDNATMQAQENRELQARNEGSPNPYDERAREIMGRWQQNRGDAYSALKQQSAATQGTVQPSPTPTRPLFKSTDIEHHDDGSATVRHTPMNGGNQVSYAVPKDADVVSAIQPFLT